MENLKREDRRARTEAVATRRLRRLKEVSTFLYRGEVPEGTVPGKLKKNKGIGRYLLKKTNREWDKIYEADKEEMKDKRRNGPKSDLDKE